MHPQNDASVAQLVEHLTLNQGVQGSTPCGSTEIDLPFSCESTFWKVFLFSILALYLHFFLKSSLFLPVFERKEILHVEHCSQHDSSLLFTKPFQNGKQKCRKHHPCNPSGWPAPTSSDFPNKGNSNYHFCL